MKHIMFSIGFKIHFRKYWDCKKTSDNANTDMTVKGSTTLGIVVENS